MEFSVYALGIDNGIAMEFNVLVWDLLTLRTNRTLYLGCKLGYYAIEPYSTLTIPDQNGICWYYSITQT
jgi:hypothetical protein